MSHLKDIAGSEGSELRAKRIALCVTASVSITEAPSIARLLMRHGADVTTVMTPEAIELVSPAIFEWSTGNPAITKISGRVEHVELLSEPSKVDLILVAPCTANTMAKISTGIADNAVSALLCTALGTKTPIIIASAMHEPMTHNPAIQDAKSKLERYGIKFVEGRLIESKSKLASPQEILHAVLAELGDTKAPDLKGLSFLITAGPTREAIDQVRFLTNASSGKMGVALASTALRSNARSVQLIHGPNVDLSEINQNKIESQEVVSANEMAEAVLDALSKEKIDVFISAAAPADYAPVHSHSGKIRTRDTPLPTIRLSPTRKIISLVKEKYPQVFVLAFKAEHQVKEAELIRRARETLRDSKADMIVANDVGRKDIGFGSDFNEVIIISSMKDEKVTHLSRGRKDLIAREILASVAAQLSKRQHV